MNAAAEDAVGPPAEDILTSGEAGGPSSISLLLEDRIMLKQILHRLPSVLVAIIVLPVVAGRYFRSETGSGYAVSLFDKLRLLSLDGP